MIRRCAALAAILVLCVIGAGCETAAKIHAAFDPSQRPVQLAYVEVINQYLAKEQRHDAAAMVMMAAALPLNWQVRQAMIARRIDAFGLTQAMENEELAEQKAEFLQYNDVVISIYLPDEKWNNLSGQDPNFRIYLEGPDGRKSVPLDRRRIRKRTAINMALYPFWGKWSNLYRVRFPLTDEYGAPLLAAGQTQADLIITGAPGSVRMPLVVR